MRRAIVITAALLIIALVLGGVAAQSPFEIRVFIDNENLTVYIPASGLVSLRGFGFQVQVNGQTITALLQNYEAFGIPFDQLPAPVCFRLRRAGSAIPLPVACSGITTLTQDLSPASVFWFDPVSGLQRALLLLENEVPSEICPPGSNECIITYVPLTYTPTSTYTATATPTITPSITPTPEFTTIPTSTPTSVFTPTLTPYPVFIGENTDWVPQIENINGLDVAFVPPGCFTMGNNQLENAPTHRQCIDQPFYIGVTEVTREQYSLCVEDGACTWGSASGRYEPITVSWFQAQDFVRWWGGRLPTEHEWEFVAKGVNNWTFPWGESSENVRMNIQYDEAYNVYPDGYTQIAPIGSYLDNRSWVGALDLLGNAMEWTSSIFMDYPYVYGDGREANTYGNTHIARVLRGGSWRYSGAIDVLSSVRQTAGPDHSSSDTGFRVARDYP